MSKKDEYRKRAINGKHWTRVFYDDAKANGHKYAAVAARPSCVDVEDNDNDFYTYDKIEDIYQAPFVKKWLKNKRMKSIDTVPRGDLYIMMVTMDNDKKYPIAFIMDLADYDGLLENN